MNQIQSDRDTKTHISVQPFHFIISLLLFFPQTVHLSVILLDHYSLTQVAHNYFILTLGFVFWQTWVSERNILTCFHRCGWPASLAWMGKQMHLLPVLLLFCLIFSASLIPTLLQWSSSGAALGEQPWRKCHNRGINQMYIEPAWLAELMWCFYATQCLLNRAAAARETPRSALRPRGPCDPGVHVTFPVSIPECTTLHFHKTLIWIRSLSIVGMVWETDLEPDKGAHIWSEARGPSSLPLPSNSPFHKSPGRSG